jgi:hypothetical protein
MVDSGGDRYYDDVIEVSLSKLEARINHPFLQTFLILCLGSTWKALGRPILAVV